jgi:hypothetical protein
LDTYKFDYVAPVDHDRLLVVLFESDTSRMAMLARPDFHMLIAGEYKVESKPLTDKEIAAPPPHANDPDTMPIMSGMPKMPAH